MCSPVIQTELSFFAATATYRLMPKITLLQEVRGEQAEKLAKCFSKGVIELETVNGEGIHGTATPVLSRNLIYATLHCGLPSLRKDSVHTYVHNPNPDLSEKI